MDTTLIAEFLRERLTTTELMREAASLIGVSVATMYRYRANPEGMPLGKLSALAKHLGLPLGGTVQWSKADIFQSEQRRFELEDRIAEERGTRHVVTPSFTVNCERPEFTSDLWRSDYPMADRTDFEAYASVRQKRQSLYLSGHYQSFELIVASCYRDFFERRGRFKGISDRIWTSQHQAIVETAALPHVHRRVYLRNTPELPVFTCYSTNSAVVRVDDFTVEFGGPGVVSELVEIFIGYFENAEVKTDAEVRSFLESPISFA